MSTSVIAAIGSGGLVGFMLGLLGGGGSILATPLLLYLSRWHSRNIAIGTGALAVSVNAFVNFASHATKGKIWWRCAMVFAAIGSIGALAGSSLGKAMDGSQLLFLFGVVMVAIATLMLRGRKVSQATPRPVDAKMCVTTTAVALVSGLASGFFGIGGGFLIVPGLMAATGMPMISAVVHRSWRSERSDWQPRSIMRLPGSLIGHSPFHRRRRGWWRRGHVAGDKAFCLQEPAQQAIRNTDLGRCRIYPLQKQFLVVRVNWSEANSALGLIGRFGPTAAEGLATSSPGIGLNRA